MCTIIRQASGPWRFRGAARTVLVALTAAATTMRLASATSAASAGAVTCVVFMLWSLVARDWQRPASHLPVVRVIHPVLTVAGATATAAVVCDMLAFDGLERTDWLLVVIVAGASSQLMVPRVRQRRGPWRAGG